MARTPLIQQLIDLNKQRILDNLRDGATVSYGARLAMPEIAELEAIVDMEKQARIQQSAAQEGQPQDVAAINNQQQQDREWINNPLADTLGAFSLGAGKMANDTLVGGTGYGLGVLGRAVEAISPWSGEDEEETLRRMKLRALGVSRRIMPTTRVYNDSWLTSGAKGVLGFHNAIEDEINALRKDWIGDNPSRIAELFEGSGSSFGFMASRAALASNPITALFALSGLEALSEAGGFMGDAYRRGMYDKGALSTATKSLGTNFLLNMALDYGTSRLSPYVRNIQNPYKRWAAGAGAEILNEIMQEPSQHVIENAALNSLNNGTGFTGELWDSSKD